ncbi:hypothetical protein SAMN05421759_10485 [Roseivivax lentus]|uniref:Metal binding domain of Ada n=2 Tax=Roseivivax lentus TaxID=633194 RepID=A0A1N7M8Z1_9RHOB|nr:hypothetical protein SAMN05421759_10485 [Roseivivax lentus]
MSLTPPSGPAKLPQAVPQTGRSLAPIPPLNRTLSMPLQNRVTPFGEIVAAAWRGGAMGNRGRLHGKDRTLGRARWAGKAWITCLLDFKGRQRTVMAPGSYTELFFSDEAVALAAGHRPCAECRRSDYTAFRAAFARAFPEAGPTPRAREMDERLHAARRDTTADRRLRAGAVPAGVFATPDERRALLRWHGAWWEWSDGTYRPAECDPDALLRPLTPAPLIAVLEAGYLIGIQPEI